MYAPKLQPYTREERWTMGFHHRIDSRSEEIKAEIKAMADKARAAFAEPSIPASFIDNALADVQRALAAWHAPSDLAYMQRMAAAQNINPYDSGFGAMVGAAPAHNSLWTALGNPLGFWPYGR